MHEIDVSREKPNLGHRGAAVLIRSAAEQALRAEGIEVPCLETGAVMLGDMMISLPACEKQGVEFGHGFNREIRYLTVHSVLHLLGYDHLDEGEQKRRMRAREKEIMGDQ